MANPFKLVVVTPEATALDKSVSYVSIPAVDGELGIMAHHAALIARLGSGELRFEIEGQTQRYYVDGGFAQVFDNTVSVLTGTALPADKIDETETRQALADAESHRPENAAEEARRQRTINQSRAKLRMVAKR